MVLPTARPAVIGVPSASGAVTLPVAILKPDNGRNNRHAKLNMQLAGAKKHQSMMRVSEH